MNKACSRLWQEVKSRGFLKTVHALPGHLRDFVGRWVEGALDRRYGTDTQGYVQVSQMDLSAGAGEQSKNYFGIETALFRRMIRQAKVTDYTEYVFIDFGSGKGKALLLAAAKHPFRRFIGIEHARNLHEIALKNVALFAKRNPRGKSIEVYCGDALQLALPQEKLFCFLFNPFGPAAMAKFVARLEASYRDSPRAMLVAYRTPTHHAVFDTSRILELVYANPSFRIYRTS